MEPVVLPIGPVEIHAYTVFLFLALAGGGGLLFWELRRYGLTNKASMWLIIGALAGGVLGGKASMLVFLGPKEFFTHLPELSRTGMALSGALIGGYIGVRLMERPAGISCRCDLFAVALPLGQAIGRIGNFLAADAYGAPTSLPWGVSMAGATRHPVQLYEAALALLLFGLLWRLRERLPQPGDLFRLYIAAYSAIRFPLEFLRYQPTPREFLGLTLVQHLCLVGVVVFGGWLAYSIFQAWWSQRRSAAAQPALTLSGRMAH